MVNNTSAKTKRTEKKLKLLFFLYWWQIKHVKKLVNYKNPNFLQKLFSELTNVDIYICLLEKWT